MTWIFVSFIIISILKIHKFEKIIDISILNEEVIKSKDFTKEVLVGLKGPTEVLEQLNNATLCMMKNGKECFCSSSSLYELNLALNKNCVILLS